MGRYQDMIQNTLDEMKCKQPFQPLQCIPVYGSKAEIQGYLRPVTKDYKVTVPDCAKLLAKWRNENSGTSRLFATPRSTEKWLDNSVLEREDRILFLIIAADEEKIGHIGLSAFDYQEKSCELDAVIRGVKAGYPGMMTFAMNTLIDWSLTRLKIRQLNLRVLVGNAHAIEFYEKNCFIKLRELPVYRFTLEDVETWMEERQYPDQISEKQYWIMQLDINQWRQQNPLYAH